MKINNIHKTYRLGVLVLSLAIGAIGLIGQSRLQAESTTPAYSQYTVQQGDTLNSIADKYSTTTDEIKTDNSLKSNVVKPNQVIKVPQASKPAAVKVTGLNVHTVANGDTLASVAIKYGITAASLKSANNMLSNQLTKGQKLTIPGKSLKTALAEKNINTSSAKIKLFIDKTDHILTVYANEVAVKAYHVELGDSGLGDKAISGDHKTPEGTFYICEKSVLSPADQYLGTRWMRLSYPSIEDAQRGLNQGLISKSTYNSIVNANNNGSIPLQRTALGGGVGIHGGSTTALGKDWTYGCTGLSNRDVEEIYPYIRVGTRVVIQR